MAGRIELDRPLIEPIFSQSEPNEPIHLGHVPVQLGDEQGTTYENVAEVVMNLYLTNGLNSSALGRISLQCLATNGLPMRMLMVSSKLH